MHFKEYRNNVREPMWRALADAAGEGGMQIAAELMGRVRQQPTMTETVMPMRNGLSVVALLIKEPI